MNLRRVSIAFALGLSALTPVRAHAEDLTIHVLPREVAHEPPAGVVRVTKLSAALERAAAHLPGCATCTVTIQVAHGEQLGKGQVGRWTLPETHAPRATLRILGGFDLDMSRRDPLRQPTVLVTTGRRSAPVLAVEGRDAALRELVVSGFAFDVSPGNSYDARSGALHKGGSSSWPILAFGSLATERLVIADNVFAHAANGVAAPALRAVGDKTQVVVRNNLFLNNVHCWQIVGLPTRNTVARYLVEGNTFLRNFPYNPDRDTSNPGALQIGNEYSARRVEIRRNLFADNPGGALFPQWDEKRGPVLVIAENLFFRNAGLFGATDPGKGAVVGKFNGGAVNVAYSPDEVAEDFSWTSADNVVLDPGLERDVAAAAAEATDVEDASEPADDELAADDGEVVSSPEVQSFAPRAELRLDALPFAQDPVARTYGASPDRVVAP